MSIKEKDLYFVAVKLLVRDGDNLLITKDIFDDGWDLPGGRIRKDEFETDLTDVIKRKITEELGDTIEYEIEEPVVFFKHERIENETGEPVRIFAVGFEAKYLGGDIQLGDHHEKYEWVSIHEFDPSTHFTGGWCKGLEEYLSTES